MAHLIRTSRADHIPDISETIVTALLVFEILFRFVADWRRCHKRRRNWIDLGLAVITAILQVPQIRNNGQLYAWLSVFQIARIYRVILAASITRELLVRNQPCRFYRVCSDQIQCRWLSSEMQAAS
jgi:hypothetical protein